MSYSQNVPGWGTNQFQFGQPPAPTYQPQPNWGGMDYYNAHAVNPDSSLYDHAWNRVRQYSGSSMEQGPGVGMHEAKHWHRRAYGGLGELGQMPPTEIGHAAAYEAYRTWTQNSSLHEPLAAMSKDKERVSLVSRSRKVGPSRLLQFSNRSMDNYARMAASDSAAATASIIFYHNRDRDDDGGYRSRSRSRSRNRHGSFASSSYEDSYAPDPYASDPYASDHLSSSYPRHRSQSRHRSHSPMMQFPGTQMAGSGSMTGSNVGPIPSGGAYGAPAPYPGSAMPMQIPSYGGAAGMPMAHSMSYAPVQYPQNAPVQYPRMQYAQPGQYMMPRAVVAPQPQTIIISGSGHRKHRSKKSSKRSRSIDYPRHSSSRHRDGY
ncbi:hypothetical protein B0H17DRAFT_1081840 [Mycena rosella]|uniref:Uncharacterized protein n=1 Tax=Mycena rosella TaxID=1033263 RepID=A0AAD7GBW7_MYCRO|nr:hypothetical protein B0H17DRAFT_1081840 [Mycena rosella]